MIKLNDREIRVMEYIAKSRNCEAWLSIFEKVVRDCVDIRNIEGDNLDVELKARKKAAEIIQDNFISKLRVLAGKVDPPNLDEYQ